MSFFFFLRFLCFWPSWCAQHSAHSAERLLAGLAAQHDAARDAHAILRAQTDSSRQSRIMSEESLLRMRDVSIAHAKEACKMCLAARYHQAANALPDLIACLCRPIDVARQLTIIESRLYSKVSVFGIVCLFERPDLGAVRRIVAVGKKRRIGNQTSERASCFFVFTFCITYLCFSVDLLGSQCGSCCVARRTIRQLGCFVCFVANRWYFVCICRGFVFSPAGVGSRRTHCLAHFLEIATECLGLNNYSSIVQVGSLILVFSVMFRDFQIMTGLQSPPVFRLRKSWKALSVSAFSLCTTNPNVLLSSGNPSLSFSFAAQSDGIGRQLCGLSIVFGQSGAALRAAFGLVFGRFEARRSVGGPPGASMRDSCCRPL